MLRDSSTFLIPCVSVVESKVDSPILFMPVLSITCALMGFGGVLALGCTVGAGLTGMSTLSLGSLIALASIVSGGAIGHFVKTRVVGGRSPAIVPAE